MGRVAQKIASHFYFHSVIFFCAIMNTFRKKTHFLPQHNIFYQKQKKNERRKKLCVLLLWNRFFQCFWERLKITIERQKKILRLRNSIAQEFHNFFFRKAHWRRISKRYKKKPTQKNVKRGITCWSGTYQKDLLFWYVISISTISWNLRSVELVFISFVSYSSRYLKLASF